MEVGGASRRSALSEINDTHCHETPKSASPDEMVILQRGPRCKPETWSPYEFDKTNILAPGRDETPVKAARPRIEVSLKLRKRLNLSPTKCEEIGDELAKRVRALPKYNKK